VIARDRHGRGIRRPLPSRLFRFGTERGGFFQQVVEDACEFLRERWPTELGNLNWRIMDVPVLDSRAERVRRWQADKNTMTITLYRIPIQRMRPRRSDQRMYIERAVFTAAAALIDRDPWELLHPDHD
jgi:hypothetical protein